MKSAMKRIFSLALALVMIIGMVPAMAPHVHAATIGGSGLTDTTIGLSATDPTANWKGDKGTVIWTAGGTDVTCVATGNGGFFKVAADSTLTITNSGESGKLAFDWTLTGNGTVSGIITATSGSYSADLANGASTTLTVESTAGDYTCTLTISNLRIIRDTGAITSTFLPGENGSYTVDGTAITAATELSKSATESYALVATPASGYQFLGWYNETTASYISYATTASINLDVASTIKPVFVSSNTAIFGVGAAKFADLNEANTAASNGSTKTIVLLNSGTLAAGEYTISSGNTLLVPFDDANTLYTVKGTGGHNGNSYTTPTVYRKLTLASGANITVNGAISVSAKHTAGGSANGQTSYCGTPTGPCGFMDLASGSSITVNNGGALYAWGFVTGSGEITAKSGATVYENMQVTDFRGGTATTSMTGGALFISAIDCGGTFPFSQYYVQNIEAKLTLEQGANEYATVSLNMSSQNFSSTVKFIGSDALFTIESGSVSKWYDGSKDRLNLEVNGTVKLNAMNLEISSQKINSGEYTLPITNNITITVKSGSVVNLNQDMALLPGTEVYVEEGADLTVPDGYSLYVYDGDEWSNYYLFDNTTEGFVKYTNGAFVNQSRKWTAVAYAPGRTYTRTQADVSTDAKVVLDGTLTINGNADSMSGVFTTEGGANIITNGTGCVIINAPSYYDDYFQCTYQVLQPAANGDAVGPVYIRVTPLKLHNGNGDYTETYDSVADDFYAWNTACGMWTKNAYDAHTYESKVVAPTCTTEGYTAQTCIYCGHEGEHTDIVAATGHSNTSVVTAPTCTAQGYTTHTCTVCGNVQVDTYVDATGHNYVAGTVVAPTCTAQGYTVYTCSCGAAENRDYVNATGHSYTAVVTEPTCTAAGYTTYTCSCGDTYKSNEVAALGHAEETVAGTAATCTATGLTDGKKCTVCGTVTVAQEVIPARGHTEEVIPGTAATCTATGLTDGKKCTVCGTVTVAQEVIPAQGHTEVVDVAVDPTCTATGLTEGKHCSVCGTVTVAQTEVPALDHSWNEGEVTTAPSCNAEGVKTYTCVTCSETKTEAINATGHTAVEDAAVEATCTTAGKTAGTHCSICGANLSGNEEIPALGHSYEAVVTAPSCTKAGYTTYTCGTCGDSYVADEVTAPGHRYKTVVTAPSCTEAGYTTYTCGTCGDTYKADEVAAPGHTEKTVAGKAATCTATGLTEGKVCSVCEEVLVAQTEIPVLGHEITTTVVAPTCTEQGYTLTTCSRCDYNEKSDFIDSNGHDYGAVRTEPTCTDAGSIVYTCHCGDTYTETINATGHKYESVVTEPTCTEQGYTTYTCSCGDSYADNYTDVIAHTYETVAETVAPTCTEQGYTVYECECGATENRDYVDALNHEYKSVVTEPTCLTGGYTTHSCTRCDSSYTDSETAATGHIFGEWYESKKADCTTDGENRRDCANCDHYETEVIAHAGHSYDSVVTAPTCIAAGYTTYTCSVCGDTYTGDETEALGHTYENGICSVCGEADPDAVKMTGSIRARNATLNLLDKVSVVYKCTDDTIVTNNEQVAERGVLLFASAELAATKDPSKAYETIILEYNASEDRYIGQSEGIDARDMDKSQFAVAYVKMIDGTYIFGTKNGEDQIVEYSPLIYCTKNKDNAQVGALCRAMMHYGAAAQVEQYGMTTGLMNEGFEAIPYDEAVLGESVFSADTAVTNGLKLRSVTMDLKGAISYVVKFTAEDAALAGKQLYAEYTLLGETESVELVEGSDGRLWATISGVPAKDLGSTLTVKAYWVNDNGERMYSGELVYSGYEYVRRALTNTSYTDTVKELAKALAMYISYADAYGN